MMSTNRAEEQIAIALEYVQSKRRLEHIVQAANALVAKFIETDELTERVRITYELLRRNFVDEICIDFHGQQFGTVDGIGKPYQDTSVLASIHLFTHGEKVGTVNVKYSPPGKLGLTTKEWKTAIELLVNILALGIGGHSRWNQ